VLVFLFLAALYECWAIPSPSCSRFPGLVRRTAGRLSCDRTTTDIYTQIGIVTLIGLSAKNAILIVEYAKLRRDEAFIYERRRSRRPICGSLRFLMTSFAFILRRRSAADSTGAGASSRRALGTAVSAV